MIFCNLHIYSTKTQVSTSLDQATVSKPVQKQLYVNITVYMLYIQTLQFTVYMCVHAKRNLLLCYYTVVNIMVLISDGNSEIGQIESCSHKSDFISPKRHIFLDACTASSELPSYVSIMVMTQVVQQHMLGTCFSWYVLYIVLCMYLFVSFSLSCIYPISLSLSISFCISISPFLVALSLYLYLFLSRSLFSCLDNFLFLCFILSLHIFDIY